MSEDSTLSFAEFIGTGRSTHDIGGVINDDALVNISGRVYLGRLYIEVETGGGVILTIGNHVSTDRKTVERELYDWACSEGHCDLQWIAESIASRFIHRLIHEREVSTEDMSVIRRVLGSMGLCADNGFCDVLSSEFQRAGFADDDDPMWVRVCEAAVKLFMDADRVDDISRRE